jgi:hypothetical protein
LFISIEEEQAKRGNLDWLYFAWNS